MSEYEIQNSSKNEQVYITLKTSKIKNESLIGNVKKRNQSLKCRVAQKKEKYAKTQ